MEAVDVVVEEMKGMFGVARSAVRVPQSEVFVLGSADQLAPNCGQGCN